MSCNNTNIQNTAIQNSEDTLTKINRQIAHAEQFIDRLLKDIAIDEIDMKGRMECATKLMSIYPRMLTVRARNMDRATDGLSEAQKIQQAALTDIMNLIEEECSEERYWRSSGVLVIESTEEGE